MVAGLDGARQIGDAARIKGAIGVVAVAGGLLCEGPAQQRGLVRSAAATLRCSFRVLGDETLDFVRHAGIALTDEHRVQVRLDARSGEREDFCQGCKALPLRPTFEAPRYERS